MQKLFSMILVCVGMAMPFGLYAHKKHKEGVAHSNQNAQRVIRLRWEERDKAEMTRAQLRRKKREEARDKRDDAKLARQILFEKELVDIDAANSQKLKKKAYWEENEAAKRRYELYV